MLGLTQGQRELASDKLADAANVALGALIFGQALGDAFSWRLAVLGFLFWAAFIVAALLLRETRR
jgi:hypothetical protein